MSSKKSQIANFVVGKGLIAKGLLLVLLVAVSLAGVDPNDAEKAALPQPFDNDANAVNIVNVVSTVNEIAAANDVNATQSAGYVIQSLSFKKDMNLRAALWLLSVKYQKNIVPSTKVDGVIAVTNLYDVTFEQALDSIIGNDFRYEQDGNFIKIYTIEEYTKMKEDAERMTYKVFTLYYTTAAEATKLISPLLSKNAKINSTTPALTGVPTDGTISGQSGGGDNTAMNDKVTVYDFPENLEKIENVIAGVDIRPRQVLVEATILSATLTEDTQFGIDWQTLKGTAVTGISGVTSGSPDFVKSAGSSQVTATGGMTVGIAAGDVGAFIRAVEAVSDVTLMANPKILAINKQLGQVYIGTKIAYKSSTTLTDGGNSTETVSFLDTGTKLSFRPYIGNDGYIRMDIHPKDSSATLNAENLPNETSAELVTNIMVKDGQTIVIGGLFRDKVTSTKTQIPLLGNLPLIGGLFRGNSDKTERQEVIVLLTPHIIEEPSETVANGRVEDVDRKRFGAKDGLQEIGRAKIAENNYASAVDNYFAGNTDAAVKNLDEALKLRPTYLEALRLKEKIKFEKDPLAYQKTERVMVETLENDENSMWKRR